MRVGDGRGTPAAVTIWWIGEHRADETILEQVRRGVAGEFACSAVVADAPGRPAGTLDPRRGQHSSRDVLRWLVARLPPAGGRLLGLTDVDLFIPVLTFVFGEAQLEGRAAVVSLARLVDANRAVTAARLAREAVHELGHTFGLLHCNGFDDTRGVKAPCVMSRSASLAGVDAKSPGLCHDCRARVRLLQQDGAHVYREHEDPHRR
jgi:archaemetzincin